jgi:hypothetical protein
MKLKETGEILQDNGSYKEVKCVHHVMKVDGYDLHILAHLSEQPWTPDVLDITEKYTGYRMTSTDKTVQASTMKDIEKAVKEFVKEHTIDKIQNKINLFLASSSRVVN